MPDIYYNQIQQTAPMQNPWYGGTAATTNTNINMTSTAMPATNGYIQMDNEPNWAFGNGNFTVNIDQTLPISFGSTQLWKRTINVRLKLGKRTFVINKEIGEDDAIDITEEDIAKARGEYINSRRIQIITKKAENRSEDLLRMFVSEVDFRNYKEKGFFIVKSGDRVFKIYKDGHKHIDMWEKDKDRGLFVPKNRLCVHTEKRTLPSADEALAKLLLIRSGKVLESANAHGFDGVPVEENLIMV